MPTLELPRVQPSDTQEIPLTLIAPAGYVPRETRRARHARATSTKPEPTVITAGPILLFTILVLSWLAVGWEPAELNRDGRPVIVEQSESEPEILPTIPGVKPTPVRTTEAPAEPGG